MSSADSATRQSEPTAPHGVADLGWGLLGVLRFECDDDPETALRILTTGAVRASLEELGLAMSRALEDEMARQNGRVLRLVLAIGDDLVCLVGGGDGSQG